MIKNLTVINLKPNSHVVPTNGEVLVLKTCMRTLVVGLGDAPFLHLNDKALNEELITDTFKGKDAYAFMLETICGLRSKVLAESEVVRQFKEAYREFQKVGIKNSNVFEILVKLFQDNKKIRSIHLQEIGQLTYAGIPRKLIHT